MRFIRKLTNIECISLGCIILGIGFIVFALFHTLNSPGIKTSTPLETVGVPDVSNYLQSSTGLDSSGYKQEEIPAKSIEEDIILYPVRPQQGDIIGKLTIPAIKSELPIIQGADEDELAKGVGHFIQSVLPGEANNSILSGHRDTVFKQLGKLIIGDELITDTSAGKFTYIIKETRIVHKDDKTIIVPTDHAVLTVTTCYPFRFIGDAPDRYIITADLMETKQKKG